MLLVLLIMIWMLMSIQLFLDVPVNLLDGVTLMYKLNAAKLSSCWPQGHRGVFWPPK